MILVCVAAAAAMIEANLLLPTAGRAGDGFVEMDPMRLPLGVLIGRSFLYGLGAMGEAGVTKALDIIARELDVSMALCGYKDIREVNREILLPGTFPGSTA